MHESTCWLVLQEVPLFFRDELTSTLIFKLKYSLMLSLYAESRREKKERERGEREKKKRESRNGVLRVAFLDFIS